MSVIERVIALVLYLAYFAYGLPAATGLVCGVFAVVRGWCFMLLVGLLNRLHSFLRVIGVTEPSTYHIDTQDVFYSLHVSMKTQYYS